MTPGRFGAEDVAFRWCHDVGSPIWSLEADYHGLHTRCLRFEAAGYPDATQDSLPVGGQPLPGRIRTYRVHYEGFPVLSSAFFLPPFPGLAWREGRLYAELRRNTPPPSISNV